MILGFKQNFPWDEPTNFREKILAGVKIVTPLDVFTAFKTDPKNNLSGWKPKIHTMREDPHNRWKAGMSIQMVYRGKNYSILDHFNKGIPELEKCVSTQKIKIKLIELKVGNVVHPSVNELHVYVDNKEIESKIIHYLALNDGFDGLQRFLMWFNKDWQGKIIHFTDFRY